MKLSEQARYWGIGLLLVLLILWLLGSILLPFIAGMAIAYFLDPIVDWLERIGCWRSIATIIVMASVLLVGFLLMVILLPILITQIIALATAAPKYFMQVQELMIAQFPSLIDKKSLIYQGLEGVINSLKDKSSEFINIIVLSAFSIFDAIIFLLVTPVVAFYLLLDWDRMVAKIDSWLPRDHVDIIRGLVREIDAVLAGFVRGQMSVCGVLGIYYAASLLLIDLQFGLVVGLIAGFLTFIPYFGSIIGGGLSIGLALFQFWHDPIWIVIVGVIFFIGQAVEGNFLTPKWVGSSVGLHPVWLMFALSGFGLLLGFTGLLIAVPLAACIGVLTRFCLRSYLNSRLYYGLSGKNSAKPD